MEISLLIPLLVTVSGVYLLFKFKFFFILHPIRTLGEFLGELKNRQSRRSFFLALAGTLGVGNIFGVSAGILIGGAGSLFWLILSTPFAMALKYAETRTVCQYQGIKGGMSEVIEHRFGRWGRGLAKIYAGFTILLAFFMGGAMQSGAICDIADSAIGLNPIFCSIILLILFLPCLFGGVEKIEKITEILIPLTTIIYISLCFAVISVNFDRLPSAVNQVISSAFSPHACVGGISAVTIKEGFARGILSNEAGVGTSALAHSRAEGRSPHIAGLFGIFEVFFDTALLCTLTGLAILVSCPSPSAFATPMSLVGAAFSGTLGRGCGVVLTLLTFAFAYSTVICWYFYGRRLSTLYFKRLAKIYPPIFLAFLLLPSTIRSGFLLYVVDILMLFMSMLTISAILKAPKETKKRGAN
jgi:AGCS family alanine or glycine:cation symporter